MFIVNPRFVLKLSPAHLTKNCRAEFFSGDERPNLVVAGPPHPEPDKLQARLFLLQPACPNFSLATSRSEL